jgi:hypothetical protein
VTVDLLIYVAVMLAVACAVGIPLLVGSQRTKIVIGHSRALSELQHLNTEYAPRLKYHQPIRYSFVETVNSKAKLDRFDVRKFLMDRLLGIEATIQHQIDERLTDLATFSAYAAGFENLGNTRLGQSSSDELAAEHFQRIERKLFARGRLREPGCAAEIAGVVTYTSPQGRNSYRKWLTWDFGQLLLGLEDGRRIRETRATAEFQRRQERNRVTARVRAQIFKRDQSRCKMCGATPDHGVTLHVDHIFPVSLGGTSDPENLQTLCEPCNLGKSNVL